MKYYQNKTTNEIIGIKNMRHVISEPNEAQIKLGYIDHSYSVVYDMICPNHLIGNGFTSFCISYKHLSKSYKRINKKLALSKYPEFRQYGYDDLKKEANKLQCSTLDILKRQTF